MQYEYVKNTTVLIVFNGDFIKNIILLLFIIWRTERERFVSQGEKRKKEAKSAKTTWINSGKLDKVDMYERYGSTDSQS